MDVRKYQSVRTDELSVPLHSHVWLQVFGRIAIGIFAVAEAEISIAYFAELRAPLYELLSQSCDIIGMKDNLRTLAPRR